MPTSARKLFLGVPPGPASLKEMTALQQLRKQTLRSPGVSWLKPEDLHLTLHFLGSVEPEAEGILWAALGQGGLGIRCEQPFDRFHHFPTPERPRVEAVGAAEAVSSLQDLWVALAVRLKEAGLPVESRPYVPHVTLARFRTAPPLEALPPVQFTYSVGAVGLYESVPVGPFRYRILQVFALDSPL
jgi:RNA 2',3'-cyclic 3'-phosphodiesterase